MKYILSFSGGKDSTFLLLELIRRKEPLDEVQFFDTGWEYPVMYAHIEKCKKICEENGIKFTTLHPEKPFDYWMFEHKTKNGDIGYSWCGKMCRWGTTFKREALNKNAKLNKDCITYIGIAADEPDRVEKNNQPNKRLPLVEWGITEAECLQGCYDAGFDWGGMYEHLDRLSCKFCRNKNLKELRNIRKHYPKVWAELKDYQNRTSRPYTPASTTFPNGLTVQELEKRFEFEEERQKQGLSITNREFYNELKDILSGKETKQITIFELIERNKTMEVREIEESKAIEFVQTYHYSKILPRLTKYYLGIFEGEELQGVVTLGWGTQPLQTIKKIFYNHDMKSENYLEIGKMCFLPKCNNSNFGSRAIKEIVKWLKANTSVMYLYTLADGIMGKCGYVYQASNFVYIGKFKTSVYMDKATGEKIHPRSAKELCKENAEFEGKDKVFWLTDSFCKYKGIDKINGLMFRYILPLTPIAKKILKQYPEYNGVQYPKDNVLLFERRIENGKFERIEQPQFNMNVFNHNYQKY